MVTSEVLEQKNAMKEEINSLHDNKTWDIIALSKGKHVVGDKQGYSTK